MTFDESKHRRAPKGTHEGGQFTSGEWHNVNEDDFEVLGDLTADELDELRDETIYKPKLEEIDAITAYCDKSYEDINAALRAGEEVEAAGIVDQMDTLFSRADLKRDIATFREASPGFAQTLKTLAPGDRIQDDGFTSTSTNPGIQVRWGSGTKMKILIPKGSQAVIPGSWSHLSDEEDEVILQRGGAYRFIKKSGDNYLFLYEDAA